MRCELPKICQSNQVKARKDHTCCECLKLIRKGQSYIRTSGIWDTPETFKTCERCDRLRGLAMEKYPPDFQEEGPAFGMLHQWIRDCRK